MTERWLLADLGGTNARVGMAVAGQVQPTSIRSYRNADFSSLTAVLLAYIEAMQPGQIAALGAGVAGPVCGNSAQLTNHDWFIDSAELKTSTGVQHVHLLNDLQAQGYALNDVDRSLVTSLFPGKQTAVKATRLVMGLGTGSNMAVVHDTGAGLLVPPAESGHASLPYTSGPIAELVEYLGDIYPHRPMEAALSGPGLSNIYHWLTSEHLTPEQVVQAFQSGETAGRNALVMFSQLLGQVAGDLALAHLPKGGLFLIGGTARATAPYLAELGFYEAFCAKGPYAPIMRDIPISLITNDNSALLGCARFLQQTL